MRDSFIWSQNHINQTAVRMYLLTGIFPLTLVKDDSFIQLPWEEISLNNNPETMGANN